MRLSRACYDKPWRCPGWAGGGTRRARRDRCRNGRVRGWAGEVHRPYLRFLRCRDCDVVTWPFATRWLDPGWWRWVIQRGHADRRYARERREYELRDRENYWRRRTNRDD